MDTILTINNAKPELSTMSNFDNVPDLPKLNRGCMDGYCGDCRCKLVEGEVVYREPPLAFIKDNEILPCVAYPKTAVITVDTSY